MDSRDSDSNSLIAHLTALRRMLLNCIIVTVLLFPAGYFAAPYVIRALVRWSFPNSMGGLYYFTPMEVFLTQLKLALILALAAAYPWNVLQFWKFLVPALYQKERRMCGFLLIFSSVLFFLGAAFCCGLVLPLMMDFSASFASPELKPMLGLAHFLDLTGWMMLAFGLMFQIPVLMLPAVKFGFVTVAQLKHARPYVMTVILILAGILTPPDVVSQLMLGIPSWLLFEIGLLLAARIEKKSGNQRG